MSKIQRILKIIMLVISILEMILTPFAGKDFLILVCVMAWFNVAINQLRDLLNDKK